MRNTITRREFVKIASVVGGSVLLGMGFANQALAAPRFDVQGFFSTHKLYNGVEIPLYGLQTRNIYDISKGTQIVLETLQAGCRHVEAYNAESEVGNGFVLSQIPRKEMFLSLQLPKETTNGDDVMASFNEGLAKMKTDYIDLLLVSIPELNNRATWLENAMSVWRSAENLYRQGRVRAIGIVDLKIERFNEFRDSCEIKPMVNQLNINPLTFNHANKTYIEKLRYDRVAVSTTTSFEEFEEAIDNPIFEKIALKHNKTKAQVALRWSLQNGLITLSSASSVEQAKEYADIFNFKLDMRDMKAISRVHERFKKN